MTGTSGNNGSAAHQETAAARARRGTAQFLPSFVALQETVGAACSGQVDWRAKIAAGIEAALEFAGSDPEAARAVTITARRQPSPHGDREQEVVDYFAARLAAAAPSGARSSISTDAGAIEAIAISVRGHLLAATAGQLPALAPDLIYLTLMPYAGAEDARRLAEAFNPANAE